MRILLGRVTPKATGAALLALLFVPAAGVGASDSGGVGRPDVIKAAKEVMAKARYCALVTIGDDGHPQARVVDPFAPEDDLTVWVATNPLTRKVGQIKRDARVTVLRTWRPVVLEFP